MPGSQNVCGDSTGRGFLLHGDHAPPSSLICHSRSAALPPSWSVIAVGRADAQRFASACTAGGACSTASTVAVVWTGRIIGGNARFAKIARNVLLSIDV